MTAQPVRSTGPEMERHYRNVGRVAVAAADLEEVAAEIVYAAEGGWDNSDDHLRFMANSGKLREKLKGVVDALPADRETTRFNVSDGAKRVERGELKRRVEAFAEGLYSVINERNRVVHSVVGQRLLDPLPQAVHPKGVKSGVADARRPLPSDHEIADLVATIDGLIREGRQLMGRVAAILSKGDPK